MKKIIKYERDIPHGEKDKNFDIYILNTKESIFIIKERLFIYGEYYLNNVN